MIYTQMSNVDMISDLMQDDNAKWSYSQAEALAEYYDQLSDEINESIEWDAVAIRCEWDAYDSEEEVVEAYENGRDITKFSDISDRTTVLVCSDSSILLQEF